MNEGLEDFERAKFNLDRQGDASIKNEPYFVGKDIAISLGYKDTSDALKKHVHEDDKLTRRFADSGQNRNMIVSNESGLYTLILASSRDVAEKFGKRHDHILRDIESFQKDVPNFGEMFFEDISPDKYGRNQKIYLRNRDGFSLLCMGFTGKKALEWKLKYIDAFNKMEETLKTGDYLSEEEKLKLQLFSKDPLEVVTAHE